MSLKKIIILSCLLIAGVFVLSACAGPQGPAGPAGPAGPIGPAGPAGAAGTNPTAKDLTCTQCHNDTTFLTGKVYSWESSVHGSGPAFAIAATRAGCNGCHSGGGFADRITSGMLTTDIKTADVNASRIDCRACHLIHTSYTKDDFALRTTTAVTLENSGATYDAGMGNLCANCHQPHYAFPAAVDGKVSVDSTHWGAHHGPQAAMILGVGGADVEGKPAAHYTSVTDTCETCHMGGEAVNHTFTPNVATCTTCHTDAKSFDVNGVQTEVSAKLEEVKNALMAKGLLDSKGGIVVGEYPEAQAAALWNYFFVEEDRSEGVHNSAYANALLDAALEALK